MCIRDSFQLPRWHRSSESCTKRHAPFWISSRVIAWLQLFKSCTGCQSLRGFNTSCACWFTSRFLDSRRNMSQTFWHRLPVFQADLHCALHRVATSSTSRGAADTSTNWRQSLFYCCTASMEQAADGAETAAIDGLVLSWSEINISVSFCLRAPGYGLTLWCALCLLVGGAIQVPQLQLQLLMQLRWAWNKPVLSVTWRLFFTSAVSRRHTFRHGRQGSLVYSVIEFRYRSAKHIIGLIEADNVNNAGAYTRKLWRECVATYIWHR